MFRVILYVDTKQLGEVFKRLTGIARVAEYNLVANVEKVADIKPNGTATVRAQRSHELFYNELKQRGLTSFRSAEGKEALGAVGFAPTSINHFTTALTAEGLLTRSGKGTATTYHLVNQDPEYADEAS